MNTIVPKKSRFLLSPFLFAVALAACGGGGGTDAPSPLAAPDRPLPTSGDSTDSGAPGDNGTAQGDNSGFAVSAIQAPADGATLNAPVRLEVRGSGLQNVELLPADGHAPRLGAFQISSDRTLAWLDFDSRVLPNGTLLARIVAFNTPAGASGAQIVAMDVRSWQLRNDPQPPLDGPIPRAGYMPSVWLTLEDLPWVDPAPLQEMMRLDDANYQQLLSEEPQRVRDTMLTYVPAHVLLFPAPRGFTGPWYACLDAPTPGSCREAMSLAIGLMQSKVR